MSDDLESIFGEPISVYSRAQALGDGVLVDVSEAAREVGFKWPTAMTRTVYDRYVVVPKELEDCQDIQGRLHDILNMFWVAIRTGRIDGTQGQFQLLVRFPDGAEWQDNEKKSTDEACLRLVTLKSIAGPGDSPEPVITIMLPDED